MIGATGQEIWKVDQELCRQLASLVFYLDQERILS
jgi:hypothetical protein